MAALLAHGVKVSSRLLTEKCTVRKRCVEQMARVFWLGNENIILSVMRQISQGKRMNYIETR